MSSAGSSIRQSSRSASNIVYRYSGGVRRVMNQPAAETVQKVDSEVKFLGADVEQEFTNALPELRLPGTADPYHDCDEVQPLLFCSRCGEPQEVPRKCRRACCRACWRSFVKDATVGSSSADGRVGIASKIEGRKRLENARYRAVHGGDGYAMLRHHVVLSPALDFTLRRSDPLDATFDIVKNILGDMGADEGAIIYHPYRIEPQYRGDVLGHDSGDGELQWKHILALIEVVGWEQVRDEYLVFEPHFHAFVPSDYFHGATKELEERSGWIVERVSDDSGASIRSLPDLVSAVGYCLSHAGITNSGRGMDAAFRYFGEVANFEPTDGVRADADRVFRAVAPEVLGEEFPELRCDADATGVENEGVLLPTGALPPDEEFEVDSDECYGVYEPMRKAPQYLNDEEWFEHAPRRRQLYHAYMQYRGIYSNKPPPDLSLPPTLDE